MRRVPRLGRRAGGGYAEPMRALLSMLFGVILLAAAPPAAASQDDARLDGLFARLQAESDSVEADEVAAQIWKIWTRHGAPEVDRIMALGIVAMNTGDLGRALQAFDVVVNLAPEFAEGWNKRATVFFYLKNYEASIGDIRRTLALEPRHFGALSGLGLVTTELGEDKAALRAFESALEVNPHMDHARRRVQELRAKIKGKRI